MTSYVSEAISGLSGEVGKGKNNANTAPQSKAVDAQKQQHHVEVMEQVLTKTRRIQREMRGRKYREVAIQIQGTIDALTELKEEPWPPKPPPAPPEWMDEATGASPRDKQVLDGAMEFVSRSRSNTAEEVVDGETATTTAESADGDVPVELNTNAERERSNGAAMDPPGSLMVKGRLDVKNNNAPAEKDPQIDDPMHPAIIVTLECYSSVMAHSQKTIKACEMALDCVSVLINNRYVSGRAGGRDGEVGQNEEDRSLLHALMESITACSDSGSETVQIGVVKALLALMTSPKCGIHEGSMLLAVRTVFHIYLVTKSPTCKDLSKDTLLDMLRSVFNRMEAYDAMIRSEAPTPSGAATPMDSPAKEQRPSLLERADPFSGDKAEAPAIPPSFTAFASQYHTDSYLLFRALCKLSSKKLPGDDEKNAGAASSMMSAWYGTQPADPLALNSKILSLELILAVLDHCGYAFCHGEKFIYAVQNYLCVSLLKNCMSNNTQVAYLSQKIFLKLVHKFKAHLKSEIEVFVANIFLRVLESPNSSLKQKALVLEALRSLCSDPVLLTQIFLNYDCDLDAANLYKDIVFNLTKLSGKATVAPAANASKKDAENDYELSLAGVEVLLSILRAFLKAMGCPVSEEEHYENSASYRLRSMLQIDVGLAAAPEDTEPASVANDNSNHGSGDDISETSDSKLPDVTSPSPAKGSSADVAGKIVNKFEAKRNAEQSFELGTVKFTLSMKTGLKYFIDNGFVELDAREVALFFLANKDKLDKTQLGEALGREPDSGFLKDENIDAEKGGPGFYVRILHHYVDALDFTGLEFDNAIRLFLSGFRLPGEAQKIDRIMEKFAERYTRQNLDVFPSADTAFILAFSVIMLQTDLHNPSIKEEKRMTVDSFLRNNRGISVDGGDLPEDFLRGIFDRVKKQPFTLKEDDHAREKVNATPAMFDTAVFFEGPSFFGTSAEERKRQKFKEEREELMAASEKLFKRRPGKNTARAMQAASAQLTDSVAPIDVVKPMFDVTWGPLIGTLSQLLECSDDERTIAACLNGFVYAVRISAHSDMSLARDTFVNSLAKFTFLGSVKEMKHKNIESIRTLLSIAVIDGEHLGESWGPVLQCISQLGRLRLFASGLGSDEDFLVDQDAPTPEVIVDGGGMFRQPTKAETEREMEETNSRAVLSALSEVLIDKVFTSTVNLSARSIAHFIEQLVEVSAMEIAGDSKRGISGFGASARGSSRKLAGESGTPKSSTHNEDGPRIFSLQRLVEVADYNMDVRPRLAWAQVWELMARHFATIGCHENAMVSIFAIDSLRQLSFKFLEKPELSEFNFQRIFLRPFLQIMDDSKTRVDIREMILRCVDNMIRGMSHNLRSGWKIFFSILTLSASDQSEKISTLGLAILQRLLDEHLHQLCRLSDDEEIEAEEQTEPSAEFSALERRNRNANVEDFVGLCRASLSFVQTEESVNPLPIGLSMRALCHIAIYADLLSEHRVLPPVSGAQSDDPHATGYTYDGLSEQEALKMVLWRPLLDGLADGISSNAASNAGGVGCLVQRGSVMTLRAILLRHGHMFSSTEWEVILKQSILPAIQKAAESDFSPVVNITSESPAVTSLDFVDDPLPLPPPPEDEGLMLFAKESQSEESAPKRPLGQAELLVEASFADLRHGGDGNLSGAYVFLKKNSSRMKSSDQPFPDSWIATTAPIAAGMLTDIVSEIFLDLGADGRDVLFPVVMSQFQLWAVGRRRTQLDMVDEQAEETFSDVESSEPWQPCEALVRVACQEIGRFPQRLIEDFSQLGQHKAVEWTASVCGAVAETLSKSVVIEQAYQSELVRAKLEVYGLSEDPVNEISEDSETEPSMNGTSNSGIVVDTPYGSGRLVGRRNDCFGSDDESIYTVTMNIIELDSGATLYSPQQDLTEGDESLEIESEVTEPESHFIPRTRSLSRETYFERYVPALKVRCVAAHCLQHSLYTNLGDLVPMARKDVVSCLLKSLNQSRNVSCKASQDRDVAHAFQEAMFSQWGDGVEEVEEALSNAGRAGGMSHRSGSEMFFLTQEAGATKAIIRMLALLYCGEDGLDWDRVEFAEPFLFERLVDVLTKFLQSEEKDGHLIDHSVWRNTSESGGKIALYCTSFASVAVNILDIIFDLDAKKFAKHKDELFPLLCALVRVQSDEIRGLVHDVLAKQIAPLIGVSMTV